MVNGMLWKFSLFLGGNLTLVMSASTSGFGA
jgi:hypothetical protein